MTKAGNSQIMRTIPLLITIFSLSFPAYAKYSGGTGEPNDPYQIATAEDLMLLGESPDDYDKHFILTANIDLDPNLPGHRIFDKAVIASDTNDTQGSFQGTSFTGILEGRGHTISHLTITGGSYLGLFGQLFLGAEVKDLGLVDVNINGSGHSVGGLIGYNVQGAAIRCYDTGIVRANENVGGLVGMISAGVVAHCYSAATVDGNDIVGGLAGRNNSGAVTGCYNTGAVSGSESVGGLVGNNSGSVTHCYSTGAVSGSKYIGGLVGNNSAGNVSHCYGTGSVVGLVQAGGLVGEAAFGNVSSSFWDTQTSGQATSAGSGKGLTTAEMQDIQTYTGAGWDFVDEIENGTSQVWQMPQESGYPVLAIFEGYASPLLQGAGTSEDPYLISDALELGAIIHYSPFAYYQLAASFDLSGIRWCTAVIPLFGGTFDGNDLKITYLAIEGGAYLGLFGLLLPGAEIMDLGVVDVEIVSSSYGFFGGAVGGLTGLNAGSVINCCSTGVVSGSGEGVGGLVGFNSVAGTVTNCYSACVVAGWSNAGGLVGWNLGSVIDCYSTGMVSGENIAGGLVGDNWGFVTHCYSTGAVSGSKYIGGLVGIGNPDDVRSSFWDTQTSGQATSDGGIGKPTVEMQTASTFLAASWDFVDETANGTEDIWWILEGQDYPRLWWEESN